MSYLAHLDAGDQVLYRVGVNSNCPQHQIKIGGQNFTRMSEVVAGYGVDTTRDKIRGSVVLMTEEQRKFILKEAKFKVFRTTNGKRARCFTHDVRNRRYRKMKSDIPVAQFLYMEPEHENTNPFAEIARPTLQDQLEGKKPTKKKKRAKKTTTPKADYKEATQADLPSPVESGPTFYPNEV